MKACSAAASVGRELLDGVGAELATADAAADAADAADVDVAEAEGGGGGGGVREVISACTAEMEVSGKRMRAPERFRAM